MHKVKSIAYSPPFLFVHSTGLRKKNKMMVQLVSQFKTIGGKRIYAIHNAFNFQKWTSRREERDLKITNQIHWKCVYIFFHHQKIITYESKYLFIFYSAFYNVESLMPSKSHFFFVSHNFFGISSQYHEYFFSSSHIHHEKLKSLECVVVFERNLQSQVDKINAM